MKHCLAISAVLLLFVNCEKKRYPENVSSDGATFYFSGVVDGRQVAMEAGRAGYYLYSGHATSDTVSWFTTRLEKEDCQQCAPAFDLTMYNTQRTTPGESIFLPGSLSPGTRTFLGAHRQMASFGSTFNRNASGYEWTFGDGSSATQADVSHLYNTHGVYDVCLKVTSQNGCVSSVCNRYDLTPGALVANVDARADNGTTVSFSCSVSGTLPFQYNWDFGDGTFASTAAPVHTYPVPGGYPVTLTIRDGAGRNTVVRYNAVTGDDFSSCAANIRLNGITPAAGSPFSSVVIRWTDINGNVFRSDIANQQADSQFEILDVSDYESNEKNEPTKKLRVRLNCILSDGTREIRIEDAEAVIAVSYR